MAQQLETIDHASADDTETKQSQVRYTAQSKHYHSIVGSIYNAAIDEKIRKVSAFLTKYITRLLTNKYQYRHE